MKISYLPSQLSNHSAEKSFLTNIAKRNILKLLSKIEGGNLTIIDNGESFKFGEENIENTINTTITVTNPAFYKMVMLRGTIGAGEAYMLNYWESTDLTAVIRLMCRNMQKIENIDGGFSHIALFFQRIKKALDANTITGSKKNIHAHYDLSNELFEQFLDKRMMYSSAVYSDKCSKLELAAELKLQRIGEQLNLTPNDSVVEIGSGWGGLAIYLAEEYGCQVTTTTISEQQYKYAKKRIAEKKLEHKITLLQKDYRHLSGKFDKLVSIEMIEAVGQKFLPEYFRKCNDLLKPGGRMLIQAITIPEQRYTYAKKNIDFIQKYIFPGGSLPSVEVMLSHTGKHTSLQLETLIDIGLDYAQTLSEWRTRFMENKSTINRMGFDDVFIRLWEFYLCYCQGGFAERAISTSQIVFRKI